MRYVQADIRTCDLLRNGLTDLLTYEKGNPEKPEKKRDLWRNEKLEHEIRLMRTEIGRYDITQTDI